MTELIEDIQAEIGESSSDAMDLIGHLTSAESCETMEDLEANLLMAKQAAETILSNVKDQIARLKGGQVMTIAQLKRDCSDCKKTHRWAEVRSDFDCQKTTIYRIIGIGVDTVRLMSASGTTFRVAPESIRKAW